MKSFKLGVEMKVKKFTELPEQLDQQYVYELEPNNVNDNYYRERVDRNIGWITEDEQYLLKQKTVGVSGCGGMGGLLAQILLRAGVGHIKIADNSEFDESNINRQFGATRSSVGVSKAHATANSLRGITDDNSIKVYPTGICEDTVEDFLEGCDVVCDEIEFWAVGARILLHQKARAKGISLFNANTIGFGTRLFFFTPEGGTVEECLGLSYEEARALEQKIESRMATPEEIDRVMRAVFRGLLPEIPVYTDDDAPCGNTKTIEKRLFAEGKAPIIATNPPMATGFLADHILLHLLKDSGIKRHVQYPPAMPGYLYFDAAFMQAKVVEEKWW
jgi:molybdopterin/thiamine biosynthesis adenylyltransferase